MSAHRSWLAWPLVLGFASCVTTVEPKRKNQPQTQEEQVVHNTVRVHEDRLLSPFKTGKTVLCRKLSIAVNAAFHHHLVYPAGGSVTRGDGFVQHDWSANDTIKLRKSRSAKIGRQLEAQRPRTKFRLFIGTTHFIVDEAVTVRKLLKAPPTLTATAAGHVFVTKDGTDAQTYEKLHFENGAVRGR